MMWDTPMWDNMGFGMMGFGWLIPLAVIALVVWIVMRISRSGPSENRGDRSMAILKERYARGELTRDEFEIMRQDIA